MHARDFISRWSGDSFEVPLICYSCIPSEARARFCDFYLILIDVIVRTKPLYKM